MSTDFQTGFGYDDIIEAEHVKQYAKPINNLESGAAFFREATNTNEVYEVDFSELAVPGGSPGHALQNLEPGQTIVFKASSDSQDEAELEVTLEGASPESYPLFAGAAQVGEGQIKENQIVVAIFNDTGGGRFDVVGVSTGSSSGGGAQELNDLEDVSITSPASGEVLRFDGAEFVNEAIVIGDVDGLSSALDSKQDELVGVGDVPGLNTALASKQDVSEKGQANGYASLDASGVVPSSQLPAASGGVEELDDLDDVSINSPEEGQVLRYEATSQEFVNAEIGLNDVDGLSVALDGKQDELVGVGDVPGLTAALAGKADSAHTHPASDITSGTLPISRGGTGADNAAGARSNLDVPSTSELSGGLAGKQDISEKGQANGYASLDSSGLVPSSQLPSGSGGSSDWGEIGGTLSDQTDLQAALDGKAASSHTHAASNITSGTLAAARIPNLNASKITAGTLPITRGGTGGTTAASARASLSVPSRPTNTTGTSIPSSNRYPVIFASASLPTDPVASLRYHNDVSVASQVGDLVHRFLVTGSLHADRFIKYPSSSGSPIGTGTACVISSNGTLTRQTSQSKLKKDQKSLSTTIEEIMAWQPKSFQWIEALGGHKDIGLIAEDVAELDSRAVCYDHDQCPEFFGVDPEKCTGYRPDPQQPVVPVGVHYERAWVHLLAATQDFYRRYQESEKRIKSLESRLVALEAAS